MVTLYKFSFCQEYRKDMVWLSMKGGDSSILKNSKTNGNKLHDLLAKHKAKQFKRAFPYTKNEELKKIYRVEFEGNVNELVKDFEKNKSATNVSELILRPEVDSISTYDPNDYMWQLTMQNNSDWLWHLAKIQANKAWDVTKGSSNTIVASIDTWFDITHPDLATKISPHFDPYDNDLFDNSTTHNHHGTACAGMIAGQTDGGGQLASVGFDTRIIAYNAWHGYYLERAHDASLNMGADVITSSAGGWSCGSWAHNRIDSLVVKEILDNGTVIVMPAGNGQNGTHCDDANGNFRPWYPLSPLYDERIIIVTSTGVDDRHTRIENGNDNTHSHFAEVDICAPGYSVWLAATTSGTTYPYRVSSGTSFATPLVAGVCALLKTVNPCLTPAEIQQIIRQTADPIADEATYHGMVGAGRINAYAAVQEAVRRTTLSLANTTITTNKTYNAQFAIDVKNVKVQSSPTVKLNARGHINVDNMEISNTSTVEFNTNQDITVPCQ